MKRLSSIVFLLLVCISLKAQKTTSGKGEFIRSFMREFDTYRVPGLRDKPGYFFSLLVEVDKKGRVTSIEENTGLDTILKPLVTKALENMNGQHLEWPKFKNESVVLPVFVLLQHPGSDPNLRYIPENFKDMWSFKSSSKKQKRFSNPLVVFFSNGTDAISCGGLPPKTQRKTYQWILDKKLEVKR